MVLCAKSILSAVELLQPLPTASPKAHCQAVVAERFFEGEMCFTFFWWEEMCFTLITWRDDAFVLTNKQLICAGHNGKQAKQDYHFINVQLTAFHHQKLALQRCELFEKVLYSRFSQRTAIPAEHLFM